MSRNPSFSGTYSLTICNDCKNKYKDIVAILLLVELILSQKFAYSHTHGLMTGRNPSFSGTYSLTREHKQRVCKIGVRSQSFF